MMVRMQATRPLQIGQLSSARTIGVKTDLPRVLPALKKEMKTRKLALLAGAVDKITCLFPSHLGSATS